MKKEILTTVLVLASSLCFAHGDHIPRVAACPDKGCTKDQIEAAVPQAVEILVKIGKIESNWSAAKVEKVEKKEFKKGPEWVATLLDQKQRRYIFITTKGYISGTNLTGE